jgi:hypothetical protein
MSTIIPCTLMTEDQAKLLEKINKQEDLFSSKKKGNAFFGNRVWQSAKVRSHAPCAATEFGRAPGAAKASAECSFPRKQTTEEEPAAMSEAGRSKPWPSRARTFARRETKNRLVRTAGDVRRHHEGLCLCLVRAVLLLLPHNRLRR